MYTTGEASVARSKNMADETRDILAVNHDFDPEDDRAIFVNNAVERFQRFVSLMAAIRGFIWVVGVGTLLAGVVGVSNIMLVAVRERTRRSASARRSARRRARSSSLILLESVLITSVAGYIGLVARRGRARSGLVGAPGRVAFFRNPEVDLQDGVCWRPSCWSSPARSPATSPPAAPPRCSRSSRCGTSRRRPCSTSTTGRRSGAALAKNRLRTFLTAFGVFWGIFLLVVLLGAGNGLSNGVMAGFGGSATNSFFAWGMRTSKPYAGLAAGREIQFTNADWDEILAPGAGSRRGRAAAADGRLPRRRQRACAAARPARSR